MKHHTIAHGKALAPVRRISLQFQYRVRLEMGYTKRPGPYGAVAHRGANLPGALGNDGNHDARNQNGKEGQRLLELDGKFTGGMNLEALEVSGSTFEQSF